MEILVHVLYAVSIISSQEPIKEASEVLFMTQMKKVRHGEFTFAVMGLGADEDGTRI